MNKSRHPSQNPHFSPLLAYHSFKRSIGGLPPKTPRGFNGCEQNACVVTGQQTHTKERTHTQTHHAIMRDRIG